MPNKRQFRDEDDDTVKRKSTREKEEKTVARQRQFTL
jgi:hypothetical protein